MPIEKWNAYKSEFGKTYEADEDAKRFEVFKESLKLIEEHNKKYEKGEVTYTMGLNKFTDWFPEERSRLHGGAKPKQ